MDGIIFTDYGVGRRDTVEVYHDDWMPPTVIGVRGDKGQVAALFGQPCLLFDDKEENVSLVRQKGLDSGGIVVKRLGPYPDYERLANFTYMANPYRWLPIIRDFCDLRVAMGWRILLATRTEPNPVRTIDPVPLPLEWEPVWDYEHRCLYLYNTRTRRTRWDRPA